MPSLASSVTRTILWIWLLHCNELGKASKQNKYYAVCCSQIRYTFLPQWIMMVVETSDWHPVDSLWIGIRGAIPPTPIWIWANLYQIHSTLENVVFLSFSTGHPYIFCWYHESEFLETGKFLFAQGKCFAYLFWHEYEVAFCAFVFKGTVSQRCPDMGKWRYWNRYCYYFSVHIDAEKRWEEANSSCSRFRAAELLWIEDQDDLVWLLYH